MARSWARKCGGVMKYRGKVQSSILKEVGALDLAFFAMDPKGTVIQSGYDWGREKASNVAAKGVASFMGGVTSKQLDQSRRWRRRRRTVESATTRARLFEVGDTPEGRKRIQAALYRRTRNLRAATLDSQGVGDAPGPTLTKAHGAQRVAMQTPQMQHYAPMYRKRLGDKKYGKVVGAAVSNPTTAGEAGAKFVGPVNPNKPPDVSPVKKKKQPQPVSEPKTKTAAPADVTNALAAGDIGSVRSNLNSRNKTVRKLARTGYQHLSDTAISTAKELGDSIHPRAGKLAAAGARGLTGRAEPGSMGDVETTKFKRDVVDSKGNPVVDAAGNKKTEVRTLAQVQQDKLNASPSIGKHEYAARRNEQHTAKLRAKFSGDADVAAGNFGAAQQTVKNNKIAAAKMKGLRTNFGKIGTIGVMGAGLAYAGLNAFRAGAQAHREQLSQINMLTSDREFSVGAKLIENFQTWKTRKKVYGPSGRRRGGWKFDPLNKHHRKNALAMTDAKFKDISGSTADLGKKTHVKTVSGVPLKYTYFSNDRKHNYAGKTIGMRQKTISLHRRLEKSLPHGYENYPFEKVNRYFKRINKTAWHDHHMGKLPLIKRLKIHGNNILRKVRKLVVTGKMNESAIFEDGAFVESSSNQTPDLECSFLAEKVSTPMECGCIDCKAISKKIVENQKELRETSATSFGQNLRGSGTRQEHEEKETKKHEEIERKHKKRKKRKDREHKHEMDYLTQDYRDSKSGIIQKVAKMFYRPLRDDD